MKVFGICLGLMMAATGFAKPSTAAKPDKHRWCCAVEGKILKQKSKPDKSMCIRARTEPSETSKSKISQRYSKMCRSEKGAWVDKGPVKASRKIHTENKNPAPVRGAKGKARAAKPSEG